MTLPNNTQQVLVIKHPEGIPQRDAFEIVTAPLRAPEQGQITVRNRFLSVEPAMRGWICDRGGYSNQIALGDVMRSFAAGEVVASASEDYQVGDEVMGSFGWQTYATVDASKVQRKVVSNYPLSTSLGILGINGFTAYFGLLDVAKIHGGEVVAVTSAAGAVGATVCQIARAKGCQVIAITGGAEKKALCHDFYGIEQVVDYKSQEFPSMLNQALVDGVDIYWDNVCGEISDRIMPHLNLFAKVVVCGTASISNWNEPVIGPRVHRALLTKRAQMQGMLVFDYQHRYHEALLDLEAWLDNDMVQYREDIRSGLDFAPDAIATLYRGDHDGKLLIQLD